MIRFFLTHCEAALAAYVKHKCEVRLSICIRWFAADIDIQCLNAKTVGVSKPCCPACWDLMVVLRDGQEDRFTVRGRHSTVNPVELPPEGMSSNGG